MKLVKLQGGLGNQMFQYAFGQLIQADGYDYSWFEKRRCSSGTARNYELNFFKCFPKLITLEEIKKIQRRNLFFKLFHISPFSGTLPVIKENPINIYNPEVLAQKTGIFDGYFQCAQYYDGIRKKLLKEFIPNKEMDPQNEKMLKKIKSVNSVSLHVRRGDYLKLQDIYGSCDLAYYQKAIQLIASRVKTPHFFLFSDDIPWVQENLKLDFPYTIVDINHGEKSAWDMWLMKNCQHNIVANSSFSWWGAWLNENPNKIVIAPKIWFKKNPQIDIVPANWERI